MAKESHFYQGRDLRVSDHLDTVACDISSKRGLLPLQASTLPTLAASSTNDWSCPDRWLHEIAEEHAKAIHECLDIDGDVDGSHKLVGDDPYIDFSFTVTNRCVYDVTLIDELSGSLHFANRRLSKPSTLSGNTVKNLKLNNTRYFTVSQPLTTAEATEILTNGGQFGLYGFRAKVIASPSLDNPVEIDWMRINGPVVSTDFIENNYPKLKIEIDPQNLKHLWRSDNNSRWPVGDPLGSIVTLKVRFRNPRALAVRQFKLVTSGPVVSAETGKLFEIRFRKPDQTEQVAGREYAPNLADVNINIERDNVTEGWLQFVVPGVQPNQMLNPASFVVRLHIVDKTGEEHRQDVIGLKTDS